MKHHDNNLDLSRQLQQQQEQKPAPEARKAAGEKQEPLTAEERAAVWKVIYRDTHRDFKGKLADGTETLMSWAAYGGGLVSLSTITDAELVDQFSSAKRRSR